jgi:hypothetical protein
MKTCPACGLPAVLDVVHDGDSRSWHRDCHQRSDASEPVSSAVKLVAQKRKEQERLEHQRDALREMVKAAKDKPR